jgi:hypothetical protein
MGLEHRPLGHPAHPARSKSLRGSSTTKAKEKFLENNSGWTSKFCTPVTDEQGTFLSDNQSLLTSGVGSEHQFEKFHAQRSILTKWYIRSHVLQLQNRYKSEFRP